MTRGDGAWRERLGKRFGERLDADQDADLGDEADDFTVASLESGAARRDPRWVAGGAARWGAWGRRLWRASGALAALTLIAVVVVALAPHIPLPAAPRPKPQVVALRLSAALRDCVTDGAWSPDSQLVAVAASSACGTPYLGPIVSAKNLFLYSAATGRLTSAYPLDAAILAALTRAGQSTASTSINYGQVVWSPDGRSVAVRLQVFSDQVTTSEAGVALVSVSGATPGQTRIALAPPTSATNASAAISGFDTPTAASDLAATPITRWDFAGLSTTSVYVAPGLAYQWLPDGALVASESLGAAASSPAPGDSLPGAVSMWRSGYITLVNAAACAGGLTLGVPYTPYAQLTLATPVWSPDGHALLFLSTQARLPAPASAAQPPITTSACGAGPAPGALPAAPTHDQGLRAALASLSFAGASQLSLAWSPDGRRLAVASVNASLDEATGDLLTVYDCATGKTLARWSPAQFSEAVGSDVGPLLYNPLWSPDGRRLLLSAYGGGGGRLIAQPASLGG